MTDEKYGVLPFENAWEEIGEAPKPYQKKSLLLAGIIGLFLNASATASAQGICDRTAQVRTRLVVLTKEDSCRQVTPRHLARIKKINLSGLRISSLQAHDFSGLDSLEELYLFNNDLTDLPKGIFKGLRTLQRLSLHHNSLTGLPQGIFEGLSSLERLYLGHNPFASFPAGIFQPLGSLRILSLRENPLIELPEEVFRGLISLESLELNTAS